MGCPDWPKCFGYLIPPSEEEQVSWQPNREYLEGQMIVLDDSLQVAVGDFTTSSEFNEANWEKYKRHNYAIFNPVHTWIEYINRLCGALSGIPALLLFILATRYGFKKKKWSLFWLSGFMLLMFGFVSWLGKVVVDGHLIPGQISLHMMGALAIVILLLAIISKLKPSEIGASSTRVKGLVLLCLGLGIGQIFMGIQVREHIDSLIIEGEERVNWMDKMSFVFYFHRSYSILLVLVNFYLIKQLSKVQVLKRASQILMVSIFGAIGLGVILGYVDVPKWAQPSHMWFAVAMFSAHAWMIFRLLRKPQISL